MLQETDNLTGVHAPSKAARWLANGMLIAACVGVFVAAISFPPEKNGVYMDQMSYLLQAMSVGYDFDLKYTEADRERFLTLGWGSEPKGMFLRQSGRIFYFAKPIVYTVLAAPFTRISPTRGPLALNALLWSLLLVLTFRWFRRSMDPLPAAALALLCWGATCALFYVFVIHADLLIAALLALTLSVAMSPLSHGGADQRIGWKRAAVLGVITGATVYEKLPFVFFASAVLLLWIWRGFWKQAAATAAVAAVLLLGSAILHHRQDGSFSPYQGRRTVVTEADPLSPKATELARPAAMKSDRFFKGSTLARFVAPRRLLNLATYSPRFVAHLLVGRRVGLFPYMTAFLLVAGLALIALRRPEGRAGLWMLSAFAIYLAFYCVILPLTYQGGPTALGNRYAMQAVPALVFAVGWTRMRNSLVFAAIAAAAIATVYFPGRLYASAHTAVRDNYAVFQWNRMKVLPLEGELLWLGCDNFESEFTLGDTTRVMRLSEPNERMTKNRFWIGPNGLQQVRSRFK